MHQRNFLLLILTETETRHPSCGEGIQRAIRSSRRSPLVTAADSGAGGSLPVPPLGCGIRPAGNCRVARYGDNGYSVTSEPAARPAAPPAPRDAQWAQAGRSEDWRCSASSPNYRHAGNFLIVGGNRCDVSCVAGKLPITMNKAL